MSRYSTQWAAQYYVCAELTRRDYLVSLTFGNAPVVDIMATSSNGVSFTIDVKAQSTKNFWLIQQRQPIPNHYFVFIYLPKKINDPPLFFIATSTDVMAARNQYAQRMQNKGSYNPKFGGVNWTTVFQWQNNWGILPP